MPPRLGRGVAGRWMFLRLGSFARWLALVRSRRDDVGMNIGGCLWDAELGSPGIIVAAPTGIVYEQQVNGVACDHRSLEGFYVPLPATTAPIFDPGWWELNENMRSSGGIGVETWRSRAVEIERVLALMPGNA